jgi:hypothetical protein
VSEKDKEAKLEDLAKDLAALRNVKKALDWLRSAPPPPRLAPLLNRQIDRAFHRGSGEEAKTLAIIDSIAHTVVEQADSLVLSLHKTVKYNLGRILSEEAGGGRRGEVPSQGGEG